jgi:outer membrane biosynthesis protein TonB
MAYLLLIPCLSQAIETAATQSSEASGKDTLNNNDNFSSQCSKYASTINSQMTLDQASSALEKKYLNSIFSKPHESLYVIASYVQQLRHQIELSGNEHYPDEIKGLQGEGSIVISVNSEGDILEINLLSSSGNSNIDNAFLKIVCETDHLQAFSASLQQKTSTLHIALPFSFERRNSH